MAHARRKGALVGVTFSHEEIETSGKAVAALAVVAPEVAVVIGPVVGALQVIDALGGNRGVEVVGVPGWTGCMSVPVGVPLFEVTSKLVDAVGNLITEKPGIAAAVLVGGPAGWVAGGVGVLLGLFRKEQRRIVGPMAADRSAKGPWEKFGLVALPDNKFAFSSRYGYVCAENGGGSDTFANRAEIGPWEQWEIVLQAGGYIALRSSNGHYFVAEEGGDDVCKANRERVGDWEQFSMEFNDDGTVSFRTKVKGRYVVVEEPQAVDG